LWFAVAHRGAGPVIDEALGLVAALGLPGAEDGGPAQVDANAGRAHRLDLVERAALVVVEAADEDGVVLDGDLHVGGGGGRRDRQEDEKREECGQQEEAAHPRRRKEGHRH
jgi:hypothetical protein